MGQVFYDMGMLGSAEVIECSASDLVGQYVGQTGPKTKKLFEKALGKVLFIDEAYRLAEGHFAQEAIDELVGLLTHPSFKSKLIVILAGYEQDMNRLLAVNTGLSSRFPDQIYFHDMDADQCLKVVEKQLSKKNIHLPGLDDPTSALYLEMEDMIREMAQLQDWGNARDMMTLSQGLIRESLLNSGNPSTQLELSPDKALKVLAQMLNGRQKRAKAPTRSRTKPSLPVQSFTPNPPTPPPIDISTDTAARPPPSAPPSEASRASTPSSPPPARGRGRGRGGAQAPAPARGRGGRGRGGRGAAPPTQTPPRSQTPDVETRDPGVTDQLWNKLQAAKRAADDATRKAQNAINLLEQVTSNEQSKEQALQKQANDLQRAAVNERDAGRRSELQRPREEARLKALAARAALEKAALELQAKREAERLRKEREAKAQRKLRELGVCPVGFRWIKMENGYRCAGGSHFVQESQLGLDS